jgi:outer membrane protein assembly factor BamB
MKTLFFLTISLFGASVFATDWPQFRGPQASGIGEGAATPTTWDVEKGENIRWHTPIPGLGHSSPIIWGDKVYLTTSVSPAKADLKVGLYGDIGSANDQESHQWRLLALETATGKIAWDKLGVEAIPRVKRHPKGSHCSSTPATDGQRIAAIFGSEGLFVFDMKGKLLWKKDLGPMDSGYYMVKSAQWGFASSPVIYKNKIIVLCDVQTNSFLAVFDAGSGKELWRTVRTDVPTWGTPTVAKSGSVTEILVNGWHNTGGYDFATGKELWNLNGGGDIPVPTPIVSKDLAYFTSAHGQSRPMRGIRLDAHGDITPTNPGQTNSSIPWAHARQGNYMQTPILVGQHVFGCVDNGVVSCFDASTGAIQFSERLGNGSEGFTSSPVSDGRHLYFASEIGNVYVLAAEPKFSVVATNKMNDMCMATPAVADGTIFYRTRGELVAVTGRGTK